MKSDSSNTLTGTDWKADFQSTSKWDISENEIKIKSWTLPEF